MSSPGTCCGFTGVRRIGRALCAVDAARTGRTGAGKGRRLHMREATYIDPSVATEHRGQAAVGRQSGKLGTEKPSSKNLVAILGGGQRNR